MINKTLHRNLKIK